MTSADRAPADLLPDLLPDLVPDLVPEPVCQDEALLALYRVAWQLALEHVVERVGAPRSPYLDEGFDPETVWIWDTCLMTHFTKYAPATFPGIESLENFYRPMHEGAPTSLAIQHPDNPPLLAWSQEEHARHTGDLGRVDRLLAAGYLQRHFAFFETVPPGSTFGWSRVPTTVQRLPRGYRWSGVCSGMDNTPRARHQGEGGTYGDILWLDAAAQQALAARSIARLAGWVARDALAREYQDRYAELVELVGDFWDERDGFFYDRLDHEPFDFHRVATPASYWPLLAGACSTDQAAALAAKLEDPDWFGGPVPWPSVARHDPAYRATGHYWRGGVWLPMAYVGARALAENGYPELARSTSRALLTHMARTYAGYRPASIWEAYSPQDPVPSTGKDDQYIVRPDFCGWSALGPISLLIEHVLGFTVDAVSGTVHWRPDGTGRQGIRRLRCGPTLLSAVLDGDVATVQTDARLRLVLDGTDHDLGPGTHRLVRAGRDGAPGWTRSAAGGPPAG